MSYKPDVQEVSLSSIATQAVQTFLQTLAASSDGEFVYEWVSDVDPHLRQAIRQSLRGRVCSRADGNRTIAVNKGSHTRHFTYTETDKGFTLKSVAEGNEISCPGDDNPCGL